MKRVRLLSTSDLHFGNTHNEPDVLAANFRNYLLPCLVDIDLMIVAGDFFDTALALSDNITPSVVSVMFDLLTAAAKNGVTLRFLRGTFSHERTQCQYFPIMHQQHGFTNDLRYVDTITLEYLEQFELRVLYLPDDLPYATAEAVLVVVQQKMRELGWDYVDYAIVHGYFDHVVPAGAVKPKGTYDRQQFDFVRRYVLIGHVHTPSIEDKFIYNGSFDRLVHGEEEPKGFVLLDDDGSTARVQFVPNPNATKFVTLDYCDLPDEDALLQHFCATVQEYPTNRISHVRVFHPNAAWRHGLSKFAKQQFPHVRLSVKAPNDRASIEQTLQSPIIDLTTFTKPTEETLPSLILDHGDPSTRPPSLTEERIRERLRMASLT